MAELADALDLGSSGYIRAGSSPVTCTILLTKLKNVLFIEHSGSIINSVGEKITDTILFNKKGVTFRNS